MGTLEIPLFPLQTVLFPGMPLPLRIFEPRYRTMTAELLESGGVFGVLLIQQGPEVGGGAVPHTVGTTARIEECTSLPDGQYTLTARGVRRFRLIRMLPPRPYPYGEVEIIVDDPPSADPMLEVALNHVRATFPQYFRLVLALSDQWARGVPLNLDPHRLVDTLSQWLQVEEPVRQRLLEPLTAVERVANLAEILDTLLLRTRPLAEAHWLEKYASLGRAN